MRVALISSSFYPHVGGVEEHTRNVARELRALGHDVVVWTVDRGERLGSQLVDGVEVRRLPAPLPARSLCGVGRFLWRLPGAWAQWMTACIAFRPQVLNVQCFGPNGLYACALHRRSGIPLVISSHGETFMDEDDVFGKSWLLRHGLIRALREADFVTACSAVTLRDLRERFGLARGAVVENGVDLREAERLGVGLSRARAGEGPVVLAIGRMVEVKGLDLLLDAFSRADLPPGTVLRIGGDGPELGRLQRQAGELGVAERVQFLGSLPRDAVLEEMAHADLIVLPSRMEAFGIVVLEAWRSGTALLATSRGGPRDLIRDEVDGLLVDPFDREALAEQLARLVRDDALRERLAAAGLRRVAAYGWEDVAAKYVDVYREVLEGSRWGVSGPRSKLAGGFQRRLSVGSDGQAAPSG